MLLIYRSGREKPRKTRFSVDNLSGASLRLTVSEFLSFFSEITFWMVKSVFVIEDAGTVCACFLSRSTHRLISYTESFFCESIDGMTG